jgi:predicted dehydrogenase
MWPDFAEGLQVQKVLEAIAHSAEQRRWIEV